MYCDGRCQYLNERKHKCELTGEKLTYMKQTGSISFSVHEHRGFCKGKRWNVMGDVVKHIPKDDLCPFCKKGINFAVRHACKYSYYTCTGKRI